MYKLGFTLDIQIEKFTRNKVKKMNSLNLFHMFKKKSKP